VGLPGLLVALLVGRTVDEPVRSGTAADAQPLREVLAYLFRRPAYGFLLVAASFHASAGYAMAHWAPTFLVRVHGLSYAEVGTWMGLLTGLAGAAGALCGGVLADRLGAGDQRWYAWVAAIAAFAALPFGAAFLLIEAELVALLCFAPHIFAIGVYTGPLYAMNQGLARPRMRAMAVAVHLFVVSVVGGGIGPFLVGRLSDGLAAEWGDASIRHALLIVLGVGTLGAGIFYLFTSRTLRADLAEASA
jgi:predicted MFS family arabinose efflux permease